MLIVSKDSEIKLTRGDTARFTVPIENENTGEPYTVQASDTLTFTVKRTVRDKAPLFQKTVLGSDTFHIEPADTKGLAFGDYVYDVQLDTADGDSYTVIEPTLFEVMGEVT